MSSKFSTKLLNDFVDKFGVSELESLLASRMSDESVITIIGNEGVHAIPQQYLHGEVYVASKGNLDLLSEERIKEEFEIVLKLLFEKLKEKNWKQVYFVPTGHTTLALQIKLLVYHVLRISTVDLFYSKGKYIELDLDYRSLIT